MKQPRLVKIDTSANGISTRWWWKAGSCNRFKIQQSAFVAIDSVRMVKSDMSSRCGTATYFVHKDIIALQTHPIIWSGENQITGDSIRVLMEDKKLKNTLGQEPGDGISRVDTALPNRFNQLTAGS